MPDNIYGHLNPQVWFLQYGFQLLLFFRGTPSGIGNFTVVAVFLCIVFLIMFQVTATTTTPPVTVLCSSSSSITMIVTMTPTAVDLVASGQYDVVLPPPLILRETVRGSIGLTTVL